MANAEQTNASPNISEMSTCCTPELVGRRQDVPCTLA